MGYQGESARSSIQRHSGTCFKATNTGLPMAPARCATEVSTETIRSRLAITAAVSTKALGPESKSSPKVSTRHPAIGNLPGAKSLLEADEPDVRDCGKRRESGKRGGARHIHLGIGIALPGDADLEAVAAKPGRPFRGQGRIGLDIGHARRDRIEAGLEGARQAEQMHLVIEALAGLRFGNDPHAGHILDQLDHPRAAFERDLRP